MTDKHINTALISVYHKDGLEPIVKQLNKSGVQILSTGGTYTFISELGIPVQKVEDITGFPDLFGGRVKTLHPALMGGILFRRDSNEDVQQAEQHHIPAIDLVIIDLYPFEETVKSGAPENEIIEKIDIGGISLIRAASKNFNDVCIVPSREYYPEFLNIITQSDGKTTFAQRKRFATYAFQVSSHYDTAIFNYFNTEEKIPVFKQSFSKHIALRYGENPHQKGYFFGNVEEVYTQLHGKEVSYNNFQDFEAALELVHEFEEPAFVIVKHGNACGVAIRSVLSEAWDAAISSDPLSAFGGVIASNKSIDLETAKKMNSVFFELLAAPSFSNEAIELLQSKKNRILLQTHLSKNSEFVFKNCLNGVLMQDKDNMIMNSDHWKTVTKKQIPSNIIEDLLFANNIVRHTKSNAIVLAAGKKLLGSGMGQTSRVDAVKLAIAKANTFGHSLDHAVLASDAFFPFSDGIEEAYQHGIKIIIQPGGSVRDQEVIDFCDAHEIAMVFTGFRHFKH